MLCCMSCIACKYVYENEIKKLKRNIYLITKITCLKHYSHFRWLWWLKKIIIKQSADYKE